MLLQYEILEKLVTYLPVLNGILRVDMYLLLGSRTPSIPSNDEPVTAFSTNRASKVNGGSMKFGLNPVFNFT